MILYIVLVVVLIFCSAFFSGMEAALFSISKFRMKSLMFENVRGSRSLSRIKEDSGRTLSTLLLFNNLVNIGASSVATIVISQILAQYQLHAVLFFIGEIAIMTFVLLVFGEITPKTIALNNAELFGLRLSFIVELLSGIVYPFTTLTNKLVRSILPAHKVVSISEYDIKIMLSEARKQQILDESEEQLGYQILKFSRTLVREIMVPSENVIGLAEDRTLGEAIELFKSTGYSRICTFGQGNKVSGVLYAKDLFIQGLPQEKKVSEFMRKPYYVSDHKLIDDLLVEFRKKGVHLAVVCNENGDFLGIVTLNDVLKYLFGKIPEL